MINTPFERFKQFLAQILTVSKDDIRQAENAELIAKPKPSKSDERGKE